MTEATAQAPPAVGSFCWHELMTKDQAGAVEFYTGLFGWTTQEFPMGDGGVYTMLVDGELTFAGIFDATGPQFEQVPPHWMGYIRVEDVDAVAARAEQLGGKIYAPPSDIPEVGRFAVVADPTGATFALFKANDPQPTSQTVVWNELMTTDVTTCVDFYTSLFGWTTDDMPMGDCVYKIFKNNDVGLGGCMKTPPEADGVPPCWTSYVGVSSVDDTVAKAESLGAKTCHPPTDMPNNMGRFAVLTDPTGGTFAVYQSGDQSGN